MVAKSAKQASSSMHIIQYRTQTFSRAIKVSAKTKLRWPHTTPIPEDLALAGFYYSPYEGADDNVCCYLCEKNMGGWEEDDIPIKEHLRGNKACAWAILRDLLERSKKGEEFGDNVQDPRSEKMNRLREATFGKWWPHDNKKCWNPKSKKMANAGFFYTPIDDSDDMVSCPYCLIGLDGWESEDDPMEEHRNRTPTCPFFVGLHDSPPISNVSSPVKSATSQPAPKVTRSRRNSSVAADIETLPKGKGRNKRRMTQQADDDADKEFSATVESPPPSKRRKSTRATSQFNQDDPSLDANKPLSIDNTINSHKGPSKRKSRSVSTKRRKSSIAIDPVAIETIDEASTAPATHRRLTRSAPTLPPPEEVPADTRDIAEEKTSVKPKGKQARSRSRKVSALTKIISEVEKTQADQTSVESQFHEETPNEPVEQNPVLVPDTVEEQDEPSLPVKKRGRASKAREGDNDNGKATGARRGRQGISSQPIEENEKTQTTEDAKPLKSLVIPKRKRASTRATRTHSTTVTALPEIEEKDKEASPHTKTSAQTSNAPAPEPDDDLELEAEVIDPEPIAASNSHRGRKPGRGRGRSTLARTSAISSPPQQEVPAKAGRRGRTVSKRDISAVDNNITENIEPPAKRKASGLRSIQKIPTPSEDTESEVFEDSKSTLSDVEEVVTKPVKRASRAAPGKGRPRMLTSEEREAEDAPSTIYHSADDYQSSPTQSSLIGKSKREMVNNAKKELQEEIRREKVANGEVGVGGSSEDDEKENAAEEKGKKPTRTVRGKGSKGRKAKGKGKKGKVVSQAEVSEEEDRSSIGESHALVVKAMISPHRPALAIADPASDVNSEGGVVRQLNGQVTPQRSPQRKVLKWSPVNIEDISAAPVPNGELTKEEEDMTIEQWMRWVINDEVSRLEEECEKLVKNLEREGDRARRLLENLV